MKTKNGFTLIEVIVTIVISAIVGTLILSYLGNSLTQSGAPLARFQQATGLHKAMEIITADYRKNYKPPIWKPATGYTVGAIVVPTTVDKVGSNPNYISYFYKCTTAGQSGSTEPVWTTNATYPADGTTHIADGTAQWAQTYVLEGLKNEIGVGSKTSYKTVPVNYTVVMNGYIAPDPSNPATFLNSNSTPPRYDLLKVTIKNDLGETLTTLFTGQ